MPDNLIPVLFPLLTRPYDPVAPWLTMGPEGQGPLWRELQNMRMDDGMLRMRQTIKEHAESPYSGDNPLVVATDTQPIVFTEDWVQAPRLIKDFLVWTGEIYEFAQLVVTTREIFWRQANSWYNITPTYSAGTVSITNGTTALEGSGTEWATRGIAKGNSVQLPSGTGDWYFIDTVTDDDSIVLRDNYTGTTLSGDNYLIRRTRHGDYNAYEGNFFAQYFNGDLYVGGDLGAPSYQYGNPATHSTYDGMILRYEDIAQTVPTGAGAKIIFGGKYAYDASIPTDNLGYWVSLRGMKIMEDGRMLCGGPWVDDGGSPSSGNATLWWSSPASMEIWTVSPGGFADIPAHSAELTAMGQISAGFTLHFVDGISLAVPSGVYDAPVNIYHTESETGALNPMVLCDLSLNVELFLSSAWQINQFDGSAAQPIPGPSKELLKPYLRSPEVFSAHAGLDRFRNIYHLFLMRKQNTVTNPPSLYGTTELALDYFSGNVTQNKHPWPITACCDRPYHNPSAGETERAYKWDRSVASMIVGGPSFTATSYDPEVTTPVESEMLYRMCEISGQDDDDMLLRKVLCAEDSTWDRIFVGTDALDFGMPFVNKYIDHVSIWYKSVDGGVASAEDLCIGISNDNGATWSYAYQSITPKDKIQIVNIYPGGEYPGENLRLRVGAGQTLDTPGISLRAALIRMVVWVVPEGEVERYAQ